MTPQQEVDSLIAQVSDALPSRAAAIRMVRHVISAGIADDVADGFPVEPGQVARYRLIRAMERDNDQAGAS